MGKQNPILAATLKGLGKTTQGAGQMIVDESRPAPVPTFREADAAGGVRVDHLVATTKGSGYLGSDSEPAGSALNPIAQLGLFHKIRKKAGWARFVTFKPVSENTGYLDLWSDEGFKMVPTQSEGPRTGIPLHKPDLSQKTYSTNTMSGSFGLRLKALKAAARAGQNVNALIQSGIAAGIANVFLDIGVNGDTSLPADTDENKMRRSMDGWFQKIRENGSNYTSLADGFSYHNRIWPGMLQQIDTGYRSDRGLAWGMPDELGTRWLSELTALESSPSNAHPSVINNLGAALLNQMGGQANPLGKAGVVMPQLSTQRYGTEGYAGLAPTSVVDNGDGTLTINVNTLSGTTDRSSTGADGQRYVIVGNNNTGIEERLAISFSSPNNTVTTASQLGQTVVSTVAADYYVKWADLTTMLLGVMRYLMMVVQNGIRIYMVFYPRDEVIEVIIHADIDYVVVDYDAFSLVDDIISPQFNILS